MGVHEDGAGEPGIPQPGWLTPGPVPVSVPVPVQVPAATSTPAPMPVPVRVPLPPPGRNGPRIVLAAIAVSMVLSLLLGGALVWVGGAASVALARSRSTHAADGAYRASGPNDANTATSRERLDRDRAIDAAVATMTRALASGNEAEFVSVDDPAAAAFRAHQRSVFRSLRLLSFSHFTYAWGSRRSFDPPASTGYPTGTVVAAVTLEYQLAGWDQRGISDVVPLTFAPHGPHWYLESDTDSGDNLATGPYSEPWSLGNVAVSRRPHVLVVGDTAHRALNERLATRLEAAIADVRRVWPMESWNGKVVAYATTDRRFVTEWFGNQAASSGPTKPGSEATFEAKVLVLSSTAQVTDADPYTAGSPRLVMTPYLLGRDDNYSRSVLRHELTHVALALEGTRRPPTWMVEGVAEYTGFRVMRSGTVDGVGALAVHGLPKPTWAQLRAGSWKPLLVADDEAFYGGSLAHVSDTYTTAWLTCLYIADHYGEPTLRRLYEYAASGPDQSMSTTESQALSAVLHVSRASLLSSVRSYARGLRSHFV